MASTPSPASRNDRRRARTRLALIEAARGVFATRGTEASTIQEITDAADVAKGTFYNHFHSREDLQRAVAESALAELGAALDRDVARRERDPARVIAMSLFSTLRCCLGDPALGGFLLESTDVMKIAGALGARGRRDLRAGIEAERFRVDDLDTCLAMLAGAGQGVLRERLRGGLDETAEQRFLALVLVMLGLEKSEADEIAEETARAFEGGGR